MWEWRWRSLLQRMPNAISFSKNLGRRIKVADLGVFLSQLPTKPNGRLKFFHEWQINRKVQSSCTWCWWRILRLWRFVQSSVVEYRFGKYGCQHLNYWLSKFVQEVANSEEKGYLARTLYEIICGIRKHLEETVGSEVLNRLDTSDKR